MRTSGNKKQSDLASVHPRTSEYEMLQTSVGSKVVDTAIPSAVASPVSMVEVVAPATLDEGYTFNAELNGRSFAVTVPRGGVRQGEKFEVPLPSDDHESPASLDCFNERPNRINVPVGKWKDDICDCCRFGCCHPSCCLAFWCQLLALGQVMTRLHLTWYGSPGTFSQTVGTFKTLAIFTFVFFVLQPLLRVIVQMHTSTTEIQQPPSNDDFAKNWPSATSVSTVDSTGQAISSLLNSLQLAYGVFVILIIMRTRAYLRQKYAIPPTCCGGCNDFCCAFWCQCCSICQMARHTGDYENYPAECCTSTGLPGNAPSIV